MRRALHALALALALAAPPLAAQPKLAPPPPEVQQTIQSALEKARGGDVPGAIALLEPYRTAQGAHPAALSLLGSLYLESGRPQDALALLGPIAETGAAGPLILHNAGRAALAAGETERAERYLRLAVQKSPDSPAARDLGLLLGGDGRLAESYGFLRPWALAHPDDSDVRLAAAFSAVELQHAAEGEELLKGLPQDSPRVQLLRARLLVLEKAPRGALVLLEPLARSGPPELLPEVLRNLARIHISTGEPKKAVAILQGKTGNDLSLATLLGRAQYQAGDAAGAVESLAPFAKAALAEKEPAAPGDRAAVADLEIEYGQALLGQSKGAEAIPALELAARLDPQRVQAWQLLGRAQLAAGQREAAERSMARVKELEKKKPEV